MKPKTTLIFTILQLLLITPLAALERPPVDWIFVVDTSQSMEGRGGSADIFSDVQRAVKRFVDVTKNGDSVTIITYDQYVSDPESTYIGGQSDKRSLSRKIDTWQADGLHTHTGEAVQRALERQQELQTPPDPKRNVCIIILTDGIEDTQDNPSAIRLEDVHIPPPGRRPYTILVWLGRTQREFELSSLYNFKQRLAKDAALLLHPEGKNIQVLTEEVRGLLVPRILVLPGELDFGSIEPGKTTDPKVLRLKSSKATTLTLDLSETTSPALTLESPIEAIRVDTKLNEIKLTLHAGDQIADGSHKATVLVHEHENFRFSPSSNKVLARIPLRLTVASPSLWTIIARWLAYSLAAGGILLACLCIYHQELPHELYRKWRTRNYLWGVLEQHSASAPPPMDLLILQTNKAPLSSVLGPQYKGNADAQLYTVRDKGRTLVALQYPRGAITVNGKPLPEDSAIELFNGDEIIADGQKFTYYGPERP
jgi:hypothetical protein